MSTNDPEQDHQQSASHGPQGQQRPFSDHEDATTPGPGHGLKPGEEAWSPAFGDHAAAQRQQQPPAHPSAAQPAPGGPGPVSSGQPSPDRYPPAPQGPAPGWQQPPRQDPGAPQGNPHEAPADGGPGQAPWPQGQQSGELLQPTPDRQPVPAAKKAGFFAALLQRDAPLPAPPPEPPLSANDRAQMLRVLDQPIDQHRVSVSSLKGGVAKTTTVLGLGTALALHRRDTVTAIDANPHRGTLAERLGEEHDLTVRDMLDNLENIHTYAEFRRYTSQARSRLEVMAAEKDPEKQQAFSAEEYAAALQVILTFRSLAITDTGTDLLLPLMREVYQSTDTLVVPATTAADGWQLASETLSWWERKAPQGEKLVRNAVVPLTRIQTFSLPDPYNPPRPREMREMLAAFNTDQQERETELIRALSGRVRAVVPIPHDTNLKHGYLFDWELLHPATQNAYLRLAYEVAKGF